MLVLHYKKVNLYCKQKKNCTQYFGNIDTATSLTILIFSMTTFFRQKQPLIKPYSALPKCVTTTNA